MAKHLIIGCGSAGLSALEEIRSLTQDDEVKVVSMEDCLPYSPTALVMLLAGRVKESSLWVRDEEYFHGMKVVFAKGKEVSQLLPDKKRVIYHDGDVDEYDNLLIASGSDSVEPHIEGLRQVGFMGFHTLNDYYQLLRMLGNRAEVVILGAGLVGMELAMALSERGHKVTVIEKESQILPLYFDEPSATYMRDIFISHGVETFVAEEVTKVRRDRGKIEVACASGRVVGSDLLVTCVGVRSRISFLDGSGINVKRGVLVDSQMRTNADGVYAAGDVVEAPDFFYRQPGVNAIIPSAIAQGKVAGANMAGKETTCDGWVSMNVFNILGNMACSIGLATPRGEGNEVLEEKDDEKKSFKRLVFRDDRLVGGMFLNVDLMPGVIRHLIENRIDIGSHKELLFTKPKEASLWLMLKAEKTPAEK